MSSLRSRFYQPLCTKVVYVQKMGFGSGLFLYPESGSQLYPGFGSGSRTSPGSGSGVGFGSCLYLLGVGPNSQRESGCSCSDNPIGQNLEETSFCRPFAAHIYYHVMMDNQNDSLRNQTSHENLNGVVLFLNTHFVSSFY
jgi:hypothetical protein